MSPISAAFLPHLPPSSPKSDLQNLTSIPTPSLPRCVQLLMGTALAGQNRDDLRQLDWWQTWDPLLSLLLIQSGKSKRSPRHQQPTRCKSSHVPRARIRWREGGGEGGSGVGVRTTVSFHHIPARPPLCTLRYLRGRDSLRTSTWKAMCQVDCVQAVDCLALTTASVNPSGTNDPSPRARPKQSTMPATYAHGSPEWSRPGLGPRTNVPTLHTERTSGRCRWRLQTSHMSISQERNRQA